jgi:hypothetical protein
VRGEAVFVDLGEGRNVVAIMARGPRGDEGVDFDWLVPSVLRIRFPRDAEKLPSSGVFEVPPHLLPTLVTFADPNDPASARVVESPAFAQAFGPGYAFRRATIEMLPQGWASKVGFNALPGAGLIETKLPWISEKRKQGLGGRIDLIPGRFVPNVPYFVR